MGGLEWGCRMRRTEICLAIAVGLAHVAPAFAAASTPAGEAAGEDGLHVEFPDAMPAFVQTLGWGGREIQETSVRGYAYDIMRGESFKEPVGYVVKPAPAGCDRPDVPCESRRATLPDDRAGDLPASFNIEITDDLQGERTRRDMRGVEVYQDGPGQWVTVPAGRTPYQPYGGGTVQVLATAAGKLRPGSLAQADCFPAARLCSVRISYSRELRVNFLSQSDGDALARQIRAVDAVMRSVIRPGPFPDPRARRVTKRSVPTNASPVIIPGLPGDRIRAALAPRQ